MGLKYIRHNDIVEVEIEKIGKITNRVRVIDVVLILKAVPSDVIV